MAASFFRRSLLNYKNCIFQTPKRTEYVILIPETPKEVAESNVVSLENLPDFSSLNSETCKQILNKYSQLYDVGAWELDEHLQLKNSEKIDVFKNVIEPLEVLSVPFASSWGVISTLYIANQKLMPLSTYYPLADRVFQVRNDKFNIKSIYTACKKQLESGDKHTEEQLRVLKKFVWEGVVNGFELSQTGRDNLKYFNEQLEKRRKNYETKMKNAKTFFKQVISDANFIKDSPLDLLRNTAMNSEEPHKGPWLVTLVDAVYWRFLEYCTSREARRHIWISYNQLCSKHHDTRTSTIPEVEEIRRCRREHARALGFPSYAHLTMKTKMAGSVENVQNVLAGLLEPAKLAQEKEIYDLEKFAYDCDFRSSIELWDLPYWKRMERKMKYGLDEAVLKDHFPLSQVLLGLIALCEQLFGIEIEEQPTAKGWHPDVRYFRISDEKSKNMLGGFYFDPYARNGKLVGEANNGWFVPIRPRSRTCASLPLCSLIFNFTPPTENIPSLLYYREVEHLFGKFGQMLQFILTQMNYSEVSGTANLEWDAVLTCNKFLRFWLCEKGTLESISGHYDTGEPLPSHVLDNLANVHKQMAGTELCRQIYYSNLDLELHMHKDGVMTLVEKLWPEHFLFPLSKLDAHAYGFKDIFIHPWASTYYSHVWSKMVAADVFSAFVETGFNNHEGISTLGKRFRSTFLALGGGCDPGEVFRKFRGREPEPKILTQLLNLKTPAAPTPNLEPELALA